MSWQPCPDPAPGDPQACELVDIVVVPRTRDIGGFDVARVLPAPQQGMVGPFIFFDQMGPTEFVRHKGLDVLPHPHINLATVTYLFEGELTHRDSLGTEQVIRPGAVNWMSAGCGIVHSERSGTSFREHGGRLFGLQTWVALPAAHEEGEPWFAHTDKDALPVIEDRGSQVQLVAGTGWGQQSPMATPADTIYADVTLTRGGELPVDTDHEERALYTVSGEVEISGERFGPAQLLVLAPGKPATVRNFRSEPVRLVLVGGESMDGPRYIWWNFVSSRQERIEQAKADWKAGRFDTVPGDAEDFVPLPETQIGDPRRIQTR